MPFTVIETDLEPRPEFVRYEDLAPGLYVDEMVVELDTGEHIAVSVERHWIENGAGIAFHGYARLIRPDGQTVTVAADQNPEAHVEASMPFTAPRTLYAEHTPNAIATEVARIMLGEEPELIDGNGRPVVDVSDEIRVNASIRHQLEAVAATQSSFIGLK